jgi:hypothetical protein
LDRKAGDVWRGTRGAAATIAIRLKGPAAARPQRSSVAAKEEPEGSVEGHPALYSHRAVSRRADRCAALPALPRVRGTAVSSRHVRHETSGQQSVYHVVPGELEKQQFYV